MKTFPDLPPACPPPAAPAPSPAGAMLVRVIAVLARAQISCCILHGYETYPHQVNGDVDCLIPAKFLPEKLGKALDDAQDEIGARVVQWFTDGSDFIVLAGRDEDGSPLLLQLHVSSHYEMADRVFFDADEILQGARRQGPFVVPAVDIEFACILANRLSKADLTDDHGRRLSALYALRPLPCTSRVGRLLPLAEARMVCQAARDGDWKPVQREIDSIRHALLASRSTPPAGRRLHRFIRKAARWIRPRNGYHVVFLGPDGVGKSTTIETVQRDLAPAFLSSAYLTFAPGLLPQKFAPPKPDGPHSLPPRSLPGSLLKAAWWLVCYTLGYFATIRPTLARAGLVVNHRYLIDAIVDQKRYRYGGPVWLLKWIWAIAPKPDLVILLDAAPEVIQSRKQEVPFEETVHQVQSYRAVIAPLPIGKIVNAAQPRHNVACQVEWLVLDQMAQRVRRNMRSERT
ncbi:MAG TPA: hypothetical protein VG326_03240 [Tepidisphaeraceae bacterium]|jgi:thymidylate kinase|nr:hypothetical protein [Tepidisphaeraceae bacterium]